ncbi:hypothetical protein [Burkholderia sp. Bp8986]|uniref:hypothetical protein n=1 Tax=Burkholderia sp. Bp8986 TaxID=2184550 RepID=UPI000F5AE3D3|nr:hypothetical protein [Burkholderia sp. Bp8986]
MPANKILTAMQYRALVDFAEFERRARSRVAKTLWQTRMRSREMRRLACERLVDELALVREQFDADTEILRKGAVDDAVTWLVDQMTAENVAVGRVETAIRGLIASIIQQFYSPSEMCSILAERVISEIPAALKQGVIRLRLNKHDNDAIQEILQEWPTVQWEFDDALTRGQALIDTPYVQLRVDVADHLVRVLERLRGVKRFEDPYGDFS